MAYGYDAFNPNVINYPLNQYNPVANSVGYSFQNQVPQQGPQLIKVNGIESAKAYQTQPNSMVALFDANDDVFYVKTTDASNFPTIKRYRFVEEPEQKLEQVLEAKYVTVDEFNKFKEEVLNAKQLVQSDKSKWDGKRQSNDSRQRNSASEGNDEFDSEFK